MSCASRRGRIVLGDFGTGLELDESEAARGGLAGTPAYLAPEIFAHRPGDAAERPLQPRRAAVPAGHGSVRRRRALAARATRCPHAVRAHATRGVAAGTSPLRSSRSSIARSIPIPGTASLTPTRWCESSRRASWQWTSRRDGRRRRSVQLALAAMGLAALASAAWMATRASSMPAVPFKERDFVLVAAVDNQTRRIRARRHPRIRSRSPAVEFIVCATLSRQEGVEQDALLLMRRGLTRASMRPSDGRSRSATAGIRVVIAPRVLKLGGVYSVSADVVSPADGAILASVAAHSVEQGALLSAMRQLSVALRERLGESLPIADAARQDTRKSRRRRFAR